MIKYIIDYATLLPILTICLVSYKIITREKIYINVINIIILLILTFLSLIIRYSNITILSVVSNILFILITIKTNYKIDINKAIYYCIVLTMISLFADALVPIVLSNTYLLDFSLFQNNHILRQLLNIPVYLIIIILSYLPFLRKAINDFYEKYICKIKFSKTKLLFLIDSLLLIVIFFFLNAFNQVDKMGHIFMIIGIFSFALLFIITLYLLYREYEIKLQNNNIIEENKYIKNIAKQDEEFKHNVINNLLGIKTVANKKANLLIDDLINSYQKEYKNIININDLPNGIQSIVYRKAYKENSENLNLIVNNNIKNELYDMLSPRQYNNLCTAVGILFDNSLDAVNLEKEKIIEISFEEDSNNIYIVVKNSFSNIIDIEEIGKKKYTTKENGHGIGLNYIRKLKTITIKNEIINNMYITKLSVKKAKKYRN